MSKKRGMSPIVATVLIILLTVSAIVIISGFIIPFVKNGLGESTRCHNYNQYFTFDDSFGFNCFMDNNSLITIKAKTVEDLLNDSSRSTALNNSITGIVLSFEGGGDAVAVRIPDSGNIRTVPPAADVRIPNPGDSKTYNISLTKFYNRSIEIHVIVNSKECNEVSDEIKDIRKC